MKLNTSFPYTRIECSLKQIDKQVKNYIGDRHYEDDALDNGNVLVTNTLNEQAAQSRPSKDYFDCDGASNHRCYLKADHCKDGRYRITHNVIRDQCRVPYSLSPRYKHVRTLIYLNNLITQKAHYYGSIADA